MFRRSTCVRMFVVIGFLILGARAWGSTVDYVANGGTANATVIVRVDDAFAPGKLTITASVSPLPYGDVLGVFFNVFSTWPLNGLNTSNFTGISALYSNALPDQVSGSGCNNMHGAGLPKFDFGVMLGGCGAAGGIISTRVFTMDSVYGSTTLTAYSFANVGVRLQAVGNDPLTGGSGSAKLFGTCVLNCQAGDDPGIPEPSTLVLLTTGLLGLAWVRRRR